MCWTPKCIWITLANGCVRKRTMKHTRKYSITRCFHTLNACFISADDEVSFHIRLKNVPSARPKQRLCTFDTFMSSNVTVRADNRPIFLATKFHASRNWSAAVDQNQFFLWIYRTIFVFTFTCHRFRMCVCVCCLSWSIWDLTHSICIYETLRQDNDIYIFYSTVDFCFHWALPLHSVSAMHIPFTWNLWFAIQLNKIIIIIIITWREKNRQHAVAWRSRQTERHAFMCCIHKLIKWSEVKWWSVELKS